MKKSFIDTKLLEAQEILVNANCVIPQLLDYLKERCAIELSDKESLDLVSENGEIIYDLPNKGKEYAKRFLYTVNWRQNPCYESGDIVTVEDEFGISKTVRITNNNFEYAGSLSGKTEGRAG
jgi:hypothetical protein